MRNVWWAIATLSISYGKKIAPDESEACIGLNFDLNYIASSLMPLVSWTSFATNTKLMAANAV